MMRKQPSPRCSFLQQINEVSFAVNDMLLYLDTHPEDQKALRYFSDISDRRNQLMAEYAEKYGPLTIDSAAISSENAWKWSPIFIPFKCASIFVICANLIAAFSYHGLFLFKLTTSLKCAN